MSVTPQNSAGTRARNGPYFLAPFDKLYASTVALWVRDDGELFWLAPKTPPPLTAAKVIAWPDTSDRPLLLNREGLNEPLGYLELNPMPEHQQHLWLGHFIIRPASRGTGLGKLMVNLMLDEAFLYRQAGRVSLVVFPENTIAVDCYKAVGFVQAGEQHKFFQTTGKQHLMLRMTIDRDHFNWIRRLHPIL